MGSIKYLGQVLLQSKEDLMLPKGPQLCHVLRQA